MKIVRKSVSIVLTLALAIGMMPASGMGASDPVRADSLAGHAPASYNVSAEPNVYAKYPFPQSANIQYAVDRVMPTNRTQAQMDQDVIDQFKKNIRDYYIERGTANTDNPDEFRMALRHSSGGGASPLQITCSESMGYGMLMLALMAGADEHFIDNANANQNLVIVGGRQLTIKDYFDGMFRTVRDFPTTVRSGAGGNADSALHAWELVSTDPGNASIHYPWRNTGNSASSATDGDMDIIAALLMADKQWGSDGRYNYAAHAQRMMNDLWRQVVDCHTTNPPFYHLKVGNWVGTGGRSNGTRPSDFIMSHLKAYNAIDTNPANEWQRTIDVTYKAIADVTQKQNPVNGLLPGFATVTRTTGVWDHVPNGVSWLEGTSDSRYDWNACRVPWRLATDYLLYGDTEIPNALGGPTTLLNTCLQPLHNFLLGAAGGNNAGTFSGIGRNFYMDGTGRSNGSTAYRAPVLVSAAAIGTPAQMTDGWSTMRNVNWTGDFYGDYINILSMITASGNYWDAVKLPEPEPEPEKLEWPFTATQWLLHTMKNIKVDTTGGLWRGYEQVDDAILVLRALGFSQPNMVSLGSNPMPLFNATNFPASERNKFTQVTGEYYDLYQNLLDQFAEMIRLMLRDKITLRDGEDWQTHWSRMQHIEYNFIDTPGWYRLVESGRRVPVLGSDTLYNNEDYKTSLIIDEAYRQRFQNECFRPAKAVENLIAAMDPGNAIQVAAARTAYDRLDNAGKACVMNYELLKVAEGAGAFEVQDNLQYVGMRKPTGTDTSFTVAYHIDALEEMMRQLPGTTPWYCWISGQSSGNLMAGTTDWDVLEASGCLKYPKEYYQQMGINLIADPIGDVFFAYLDEHYPDAEVYLQVENMNRFIEPQMDVLSHRAKQFNCIKGFALDIEWYNHSATDAGLKVTDYRAKLWNEDVYSHWGPEYSLVMKHYSSFHFPDYYRGGDDGKSNPIIFIDDAQGSGSWDGTHGGKYSANYAGDGYYPGNGAYWALFSQYLYPNTVIYQTGYADDTQWQYNWENPFRDYALAMADTVAPDQVTGIAWVNFNRNDPRVFPNQIWRTRLQQAGDLAARYLSYLRDYLGGGSDSPSGGNPNLTGGHWGYIGSNSSRPNNPLTYWDAMAVRHTRQAYHEIVEKGSLPAGNGFTTATASQNVPGLGSVSYPVYQRFLAMEPRALDIMIDYHYNIVKNNGGYIPARDKENIEMLIDMYDGLSDTLIVDYPTDVSTPESDPPRLGNFPADDGYVGPIIQKAAVKNTAKLEELKAFLDGGWSAQYKNVADRLFPMPTSVMDRERIAFASFLFKRATVAQGGISAADRSSEEGQALLRELEMAQALIWIYDIEEIWEQHQAYLAGDWHSPSSAFGLWAWKQRVEDFPSSQPDLDLAAWAKALPEVKTAYDKMYQMYTYMNSTTYVDGFIDMLRREYADGQRVIKMIELMDPTVPTEVQAARAAYEALDRGAQSRVINLEVLKRAEGTPLIPPNLVGSGVRAWRQGDGVSIAQYQEIQDTLQDFFHGTRTEHVWITGMLGSPGVNINVDFAEISDDGTAGGRYTPYPEGHPLREKYPPMTRAEWQAFPHYINFQVQNPAYPSHKQYLDYFEANNVYVYLQVENAFADMMTLIDIYYDVFDVATRKNILGFAIDVEWYSDNRTDQGLPISNGRARQWNEHIYNTWGTRYDGQGYELMIKHYDTTHMPYYYRGGDLDDAGKKLSEPIVFCNNSQDDSTWDGSAPGRYDPDDAKAGEVMGYGRDYLLWSEQFPNNKMIFQTGYGSDKRFFYAFDDPPSFSMGVKMAEQSTAHVNQPVSFVQSNVGNMFNDPLVFALTYGSASPTTALNAMLQHFMPGNPGSANVLGIRFDGIRSIANGGTGPVLSDALVAAKVRRELNKLAAANDGVMPSGIAADRLARLEYLEPFYMDMRINALPTLEELKKTRDFDRVMALWNDYHVLKAAQKEIVIGFDTLKAAYDKMMERIKIASLRIDSLSITTVARYEEYNFHLILNGGEIDLILDADKIDADIVWAIADPSLGYVDGAGNITIFDKIGNVRLTATDLVSGISHSITLRIAS